MPSAPADQQARAAPAGRVAGPGREPAKLIGYGGLWLAALTTRFSVCAGLCGNNVLLSKSLDTVDLAAVTRPSQPDAAE
jgi:hypothetical protein